MNIKSILAAASLILAASSAMAQTLPIEREDGTLSFDGLNDRDLAVFTAGQLHLLNRQIGNLNSGIGTIMILLEKDVGMKFSAQAMSLLCVHIKTFRPAASHNAAGLSALCDDKR